MTITDRITHYLNQRRENQLYRQLSLPNQRIDFSSNDYLGLTRSAFIQQQVALELNEVKFPSGATGSRLLSGNSSIYEELELFLADFHHAEAALLFNSGFDANVGLISTVVQQTDVIFYDELVHASIHQGMKLSGAQLIGFRHNDLEDLRSKLNTYASIPVKFIVVESVYSMEGDRADLKKLAELSRATGAELIVDEAHANGLFGSNGSGLCEAAGIEQECFARVYTFGKAIGTHGAVVTGSRQLKDYLINFSKNFIYSTALDTANLLRVKHSYLFIQSNNNQLIRLFKLINYFKNKIQQQKLPFEIRGEGPVFGIIAGDNQVCRKLSEYLQNNGLDIRPILSPTVPKGSERLRVIIHSFNTEQEVDKLFNYLIEY
jgi:8-amino-7-oxononanoate synthase